MNSIHLASLCTPRAAGLVLAAFLAAASSSSAQTTLAQYDFSAAATPSTLGANVSSSLGGGGFGSVVKRSGATFMLFFDNSTAAGVATSEPQAFGAKLANFNLTVAPTNGMFMTVSSLQFSFGAVTNNGATVLTPSTVMMGVRYSLDGGTTFSSTFDTEAVVLSGLSGTSSYSRVWSSTGTQNSVPGAGPAAYFAAAPLYSVDLSSITSQLTSVSGSVIFKIGAWFSSPTLDGTNPGATTADNIRFDNLAVLGSISATAVPEPSAYALLAGLGMLTFVAGRRRSRRA